MKYNISHAIAALRPGEAWSLAGDELTWHENTTPPSEEEMLAKLNELIDAEPQRLLRIERDRRLAEVDWVVVRSIAQGTEIPQNYKDYMQALRDLPTHATPKIKENDLMGDLDLTSVTWPILAA